jgi:hypothetical protein
MGAHDPLLARKVTFLAIFLAIIDLARCLSGESDHQRLWFKNNAIDGFSAHKTASLLSSYNAFHSVLQNSTSCRMDRSRPPHLEELVGCRNSSMFNMWRPKARVIAPSGWMNDPMGMCKSRRNW